jgi:hypothetical protein
MAIWTVVYRITRTHGPNLTGPLRSRGPASGLEPPIDCPSDERPRVRLRDDTGVRDLAALRALIDASWAKAGKAARETWPEPHRLRADRVTTFLGQQRICVSRRCQRL